MENISLSIFKNVQSDLKIELITDINKNDYDELFVNEKAVFDFLSISNLYKVSKLNSDELLQSILEFEKRLIENKVLIMNDDSEKLNTNRYLLNYLFSFRTYIDHLGTFIKREYGKGSKEIEEFKALTGKLYDENFAYRFFYKLRNYAQHCGLPIDNFEIKPSLIDGKYSVKINIGFHTEKLLASFDSWGEILKKELKNFDILDLVSITSTFSSLIKEIDIWFYNLIYPSIQLVKTKVKVLTNDRFENTLNLCVTYNNEQDKLCAVDSIFRYITQIEKNYH